MLFTLSRKYWTIWKSAHSSLGDSDGWTSEVPFCWLISATGSFRIRLAANAASISAPFQVSRSGKARPSLWFMLCGMANASIPSSRSPSSQVQRSSGSPSRELKGSSGTSLPRKITFRCK